MAEEKKVLPATKPAEVAEAKTTAAVKTDAPATAPVETKKASAGKKTAGRKTAVKKAAEKKTVKKAEEKPAEKKSAVAKKEPVKKTRGTKSAAAPAPEKKTTGKRAGSRKPKEAVKSIDVITTALWKKIEKADVSKISKPIAIQVEVDGFGVFHIEIETSGDKHINPTEYNDRNGILWASYDEMLKIAQGKYDYLNAFKKGLISYQGDIKKAIEVAELIK